MRMCSTSCPGEGIDPYFRDGYNESGIQTGTVDNRCHRSTRAYAESVQPPTYQSPLYELASGDGQPGTGKRINKYGSDANVRRAHHVVWAFLACSGATTLNVLPKAEGGFRQSWKAGYRDLVPQLDHPIIDAGTDIVTITIGGNDVGFSDILKYCSVSACNKPGYVNSLNEQIDQLQPRLVKTYIAIRRTATNARVIVLGYPQLFPATSQEQDCFKLRPWRGEQDMLRKETARLDNTISSAAAAAGVEFVDVRRAFRGHEICGSGAEWINGPSSTWKLSRTFVDDQSFHPNLDGQRRGYAAAVNSDLK